MENKKVHDSETLAVGQQVTTACAFIYSNLNGVAKLFLAKRSDNKKFLPSVYELPGGHINYGEGLKEGLKREIKEELGMEIDVEDLFDAATYMNEIKRSHSVQITYLAKFPGDINKIALNPQDHSGYCWITENEIDKIMEENKKGEDTEISSMRKGFKKLREMGIN
jgi:ADP-ribose pyrophosphatase YjhB (NUDIX family)